ncbi:MAG: hypothetical protein LBT59_15430, partial [Clostridiales bacterium]|nr:hypothetical protein [Clostridiales bacterium]
NDERALAISHFWQKYGAELGEGFWSLSFDGQTPLEYAKSAAMEKIKASKVERILAHSRNIEPYKTFQELAAMMRAENESRREKDLVYGLQEYDLRQYLSQLRGDLWASLLDSQIELSDVSSEDLRKAYDADRNAFSLDPTSALLLLDNREIKISALDISKEDDSAKALWSAITAADLNGRVTGALNGEAIDGIVLSKEGQGIAPFETAKATLAQSLAEAELKGILIQRAQEAVVEIDESRLSGIGF